MTSKVGNMPRLRTLEKARGFELFQGSRPEFEPGFAAPKQLNLKKLSAADTCKRAGVRSFAREAGGLKNSGCPTKAETNF
jgi:hypothetical protein